MANYSPYREDLSATGSYPSRARANQPSRSKIFVIALVVSLAMGFGYLLILDPVYRSVASLLISAPVAIDQRSEDADVQQVAVQREILLSQAVLERTAQHLAEAQRAPVLSTASIRERLRVEPVAETNLVELSAEGTDKAFLPILVNHWVEVYQQIRAEDVRRNLEQTSAAIARELEQLATRVTKARDQLGSYREERNIVSAEREENEALSRLRGLNRSLSGAMEDEIKARSQLEEAQEASSKGTQMIPPSQVRYVQDLENRLTAQQAKLAVLERKYTRDYINLTPDFKRIPEEITALEEELRSIRSSSASRAVSEAQEEYDRARRVVSNLRTEFAERKAEAREVTAVFAEHEALVTDLEELERLYRDTLTRQAQLETREFDRHAQVSLIAKASEAQLVWPNYTLLLLYIVAGALLVALFCVWLLDWLSGRRDQGVITLSGVHIYPQSPQEALSYDRAIRESLTHQETQSLESKGVES